MFKGLKKFQVCKEYIRGGVKLYVHLKKVDIKNCGDRVTSFFHSTGVSKKNTLCMLT